jgi:hypothetical protein
MIKLFQDFFWAYNAPFFKHFLGLNEALDFYFVLLVFKQNRKNKQLLVTQKKLHFFPPLFKMSSFDRYLVIEVFRVDNVSKEIR